MGTILNLIIMALLSIGIIGLFIWIIIRLFKSKNKKKSNTVNNNYYSNTKNYDNIKIINENKKPYYAQQYIFTSSEFKCYKELKKVADKNNMELFCKMRLADIVGVSKKLSKSEQTTYFNRIKAKHIDFVLLDNEKIQPKLLIELDDPTHNRPERQERDKFVNEVCKMCDIKILHITNNDVINLENVITFS